MHDQALLGPPGVERLIGLEVLVAVERFALLRLDERSVHVERRLRHRMLRPGCPQKLAVHPPQAGDAAARGRDERPSGLPPRLLARVVKPRKPPARRIRRGQRARPLPSPAPRLGPPLPPAPPVRLRRPHKPAQPGVRLQSVEIIETLTPGKVQQDQRRRHLPIAPALSATHRDMTRHRPIQSGRAPQLQGEAPQVR